MTAVLLAIAALLSLALAALAAHAWWLRRRDRIHADDQLIDNAAHTYAAASDHDGSQIAQLRAMLRGDQP